MTSYSLFEINRLDQHEIDQLLKYYNHHNNNPEIDRLSVMILAYNHRHLNHDDRRYISHPKFNSLYLEYKDIDMVKAELDKLFSIHTPVVCVKVADIRPRYDNLSIWMSDPQNVYIGRRGIVFINGKRFPEKDSIWHNPYKVKVYDDPVGQFRAYIIQKLKSGEIPRSELEKLRGKTLGCWCLSKKNPAPRCHGQVLVELLQHPNLIDEV